MQKASQDQARYYNLRRREWAPKIGDAVLFKNHVLSNAADKFAAKLAPKYIGPFYVNKFLSPVIIETTSEDKKIMKRVHITEVKPYQIDDTK